MPTERKWTSDDKGIWKWRDVPVSTGIPVLDVLLDELEKGASAEDAGQKAFEVQKQESENKDDT